MVFKKNGLHKIRDIFFSFGTLIVPNFNKKKKIRDECKKKLNRYDLKFKISKYPPLERLIPFIKKKLSFVFPLIVNRHPVKEPSRNVNDLNMLKKRSTSYIQTIYCIFIHRGQTKYCVLYYHYIITFLLFEYR